MCSHDMCPDTPEVSQEDNGLEIPVASHSTLKSEPRALPWVHIQSQGENLGLYPDITPNPRRETQALPRLHIQARGEDPRLFLSLVISPCSKCFPIPVGDDYE